MKIIFLNPKQMQTPKQSLIKFDETGINQN